ncbi:50S ribosomal protein L25/general stress protein Ctc [Halopseudomonas formosensis]|uniref:Large ribosomal subunit protein bL25 n=1 Tax=Halopseudomonas formosensis TaxID=1002526 RepID=A0A1I5ZGN2_9GAMM|nr:50S ribosomal protein L25/general stress protein Ctc [Halopseudomonas formosensis]MDX9688011.1 50S ribosomal protein L25/general stress protein Ctc [Halopseudomonas formosensis]MDY3197793.1 50S ribosomal protein L25/general stress protein Ctc [Pseudomonadaceae bacterium]SFQ55608.1 large subunit ribosomal protein L25 [Halopseudomonas formosensis]
MVDFTLNANARDDLGKGASRRLRRNADLVPAIVYGGNKEPQSISIAARELNKALENEAFYSSIIGLSIDGKKEEVLLKALQRHPAKPRVMHADFQRIVAGQKVTVQVPLHFLNEETCVGVKQEGGMVFRNLPEVEVTCLPKDLPDSIEVDLAELKVGQALHLADLKLPEGVTIPSLALGDDHNLPVVTIMAQRTAAGAADEEAGEGEESAE